MWGPIDYLGEMGPMGCGGFVAQSRVNVKVGIATEIAGSLAKSNDSTATVMGNVVMAFRYAEQIAKEGDKLQEAENARSELASKMRDASHDISRVERNILIQKKNLSNVPKAHVNIIREGKQGIDELENELATRKAKLAEMAAKLEVMRDDN